jgi:transcriptional regulator with XRE-family HTH domain
MRLERSKFRYGTEKLARAQDERGWTNDFLARAANVHAATIGRLFSGRTQSRGTVVAVARALGVPMDEIVISQEAKQKAIA